MWITNDGNEYGINHIMDICEEFDARVLFFVDIAEAWHFGKQSIANVIEHIIERGHDVGVHIHPDHMADSNRLFLWEYSREEQYEIINKCTEFYKKVVGRAPVAFRAGKYGANRDTLDILNELGYKYDFSQFYSQKWCGINPPVAITLPQRYRNIIEFPVTVFRSLKIGPIVRYDKIDAVMNEFEYRNIMKQIGKIDRDIVVSLFYHSFSMLDWHDTPDNPRFNKRREEKFVKALKFIHKSRDFNFVDLSTLDNIYDCTEKFESENIDDVVATKGFLKSIIFTIAKAYGIRKRNKKAKCLIYGCYIMLALLFSLILYSGVKFLG